MNTHALYGSQRVPEEVYGSNVEIFYKVMEAAAPAAWELNSAFLDMWNPTTDHYSWVMPDNFHVEIKVKGTNKETVEFGGVVYEIESKEQMPQESGRSLGPNCIHSLDGMIVREIVRRCDYDVDKINRIKYLLKVKPVHSPVEKSGELLLKLMEHYKKSGYLSSRVLECINKHTVYLLNQEQKDAVLELIDTLPPKPFKVITIHDSFRCLPNYGNDLRFQYNLQLAQVAKSNMLSFLLAQIMGVEDVQITKYSDDLHNQILATEYALS